MLRVLKFRMSSAWAEDLRKRHEEALRAGVFAARDNARSQIQARLNVDSGSGFVQGIEAYESGLYGAVYFGSASRFAEKFVAEGDPWLWIPQAFARERFGKMSSQVWARIQNYFDQTWMTGQGDERFLFGKKGKRRYLLYVGKRRVVVPQQLDLRAVGKKGFDVFVRRL